MFSMTQCLAMHRILRLWSFIGPIPLNSFTAHRGVLRIVSTTSTPTLVDAAFAFYHTKTTRECIKKPCNIYTLNTKMWKRRKWEKEQTQKMMGRKTRNRWDLTQSTLPGLWIKLREA